MEKLFHASSTWETRKVKRVSELSSLVIAEASLRANIFKIEEQRFLAAGQNQFRTLWTRDFCHAVRGLLVLREFRVVQDHLSFLLTNLRADGLVARVLDNRLVQLRVTYQTLRHFVPELKPMELKAPLKPQFVDEHGSAAIDSNLLVLLAALQLKKQAPEGELWWQEHEAKLRQVWAWYEKKTVDGLIRQSAFSDWQDSVERKGATFLTNLFYFEAAAGLRSIGWEVPVNLAHLGARLRGTFFHQPSGVFLSGENSPQVSLDGNLFALESQEFLTEPEKQQLWLSLKKHPLLNTPGSCTYPAWPRHSIAWHVKFAGLQDYHGPLVWSWLLGLLLKVAELRQDRDMVRELELKIHSLLLRDGEVVEIYDPTNMWLPWSSWLIDAERPFSWGAAYLIEALSLVKEGRSRSKV